MKHLAAFLWLLLVVLLAALLIPLAVIAQLLAAAWRQAGKWVDRPESWAAKILAGQKP